MSARGPVGSCRRVSTVPSGRAANASSVGAKTVKGPSPRSVSSSPAAWTAVTRVSKSPAATAVSTMSSVAAGGVGPGVVCLVAFSVGVSQGVGSPPLRSRPSTRMHRTWSPWGQRVHPSGAPRAKRGQDRCAMTTDLHARSPGPAGALRDDGSPGPGRRRGYGARVATGHDDDAPDAADDVVASAWVAGVESAVRLAWERYGSLVFTYCSRSLADRGAAADAAQETFVSAWRSRDRFDPHTGTLPAWLPGIPRYRVLDAYLH